MAITSSRSPSPIPPAPSTMTMIMMMMIMRRILREFAATGSDRRSAWARLPHAKKEKDEIDRVLTRTTVLVFAVRVISMLLATNRRGGRHDWRR